MKNYTAVVVPL